jgi:hypothetical protein
MVSVVMSNHLKVALQQEVRGHTVLVMQHMHIFQQEQKLEQSQELMPVAIHSHIPNMLLVARKPISCRGLDGPRLKLIIDMNQEQQCFKIQAVLDIVYISQDVEQPTHILMGVAALTKKEFKQQKSMFVGFISLNQQHQYPVLQFDMI